jgi:hypothetical protein
MLHRFRNHTLLLEPARRTPMQLGHTLGVLLAQPVPQQVGEQVMVAVPAPLLIKRDEKQVGPLELIEN